MYNLMVKSIMTPIQGQKKGRAVGLVQLLQDPAGTSTGQRGPALATAQTSPSALAPTPPSPQDCLPQPPLIHLAFDLEGTGLRDAIPSWSWRGLALGPVGPSRPLHPELDGTVAWKGELSQKR